MLEDNTMIPDVDGGVQRIMVTDIGVAASFFVIPCRVGYTDDYKVTYEVTGAAIPILQAAVERCLSHVKNNVISKLCEYMSA